MRLSQIPLLERIERGQRILLAGAGGGFDVFTALPLYHHLREKGKTVHLASLSFSELKKTRGFNPRSDVTEVHRDSGGDDDYFPERYLCEWFSLQGQPLVIYCFAPTGVQSLVSVYRELVQRLELDTIVLVDGGTDSLMRGDEPSLGTPAEDMASIVAVHQLEVPNKVLTVLGFGVDAAHGVCHAYVLEAMAELTTQGAYLGGFSLLPGMPELTTLSQAIDYVHERMPQRKSIVLGSILAAAQGRFGNVDGIVPDGVESQLFVHPLMSMYFGFDLDAVARRCLYRDFMERTTTRWDVARAIGNYLYVADSREWLTLPF